MKSLDDIIKKLYVVYFYMDDIMKKVEILGYEDLEDIN